MKPTLTWPGTSGGHYALDVLIGGIAVSTMIDTGLVDPSHLVGIELEPTYFDQLEQAGLLKDISTRTRRDASSRKSVMSVGMAETSLAAPGTAIAVGPAVEVYVTRSPAGLPSRVGLAFFHKLPGCRVVWDCTARTWSISLS